MRKHTGLRQCQRSEERGVAKRLGLERELGPESGRGVRGAQARLRDKAAPGDRVTRFARGGKGGITMEAELEQRRAAATANRDL
jgi:hypothetical protein